MKIAVMLATGYEEGESLFLVDIFRRAGFTAHTFSTMDDLIVEGMNHIKAVADYMLDDTVKDYDMIVIPGGQPGANNLRDNEKVIALLKEFASDESKYIGSICAGPLSLVKADIVNGKHVTSYPNPVTIGLLKDAGAIYEEEVVVVDGHLITSRGPGTAVPFAYEIVKLLGGDSEALKEKMLYNLAKASRF